MAFGDETVVVDVEDAEHGEILYRDKAGKEHTYYPCSSNWLEVESLEVFTTLGDPREKGAEARVVIRVRGIARLEDRSISVIGDPDSKTRTLTISFEAGEWRPKEDEEAKEVPSFASALGGAMLGFNRATWEIGNDSEWWMSCYVPKAFLDALVAEVRRGQLASMRVGMALRGLYTTENTYAPISIRGDLFIRPNKRDGTIEIPEMACGYVRSVFFSSTKAYLRKLERVVPVESPEDESDKSPPPQVQADPVAAAIEALGAHVEKLRKTLKWVGGFVIVALVILALN
jgi:hypothetical protein